jgi:hypothetical protein
LYVNNDEEAIMVDTESGKAFIALGAERDPETGVRDENAVQNARRRIPVCVALDKDFNVIKVLPYSPVGPDERGTFTDADLARQEYLVIATANRDGKTATLDRFKLKGKDGLFDDTWQGNGMKGSIEVPMSKDGKVDFHEARGSILQEIMPLLNMRSEQAAAAAADAPVPDRWKTGLGGKPVFELKPVSEVKPVATNKHHYHHGLLGVVERIGAMALPPGIRGTMSGEAPPSEGGPGQTPPGDPTLIGAKGRGNTK